MFPPLFSLLNPAALPRRQRARALRLAVCPSPEGGHGGLLRGVGGAFAVGGLVIGAALLGPFGAGVGAAQAQETGLEAGQATRSVDQPYHVAPQDITEWKAVYGQIEAKDLLPARARLGGTLVTLAVSEGDIVEAGQEIGRIADDKLAFQIGAIEAQLAALAAQLENAQAELARGEDLLTRGVTTAQRVEALRTAVNVVQGQIAAQRAARQGIEQQGAEGRVLAPVSGKVLTVPLAKGAVVMAGEAVATIGGGGLFLRLSVPERHAPLLQQGAQIRIETGLSAAGSLAMGAADTERSAESAPDPKGEAAGEATGVQGRLAKIYPQISNGRVTADVEVAGLSEEFIGARVLVHLPLGLRRAVLVPATHLTTRSGLDFVTLIAGDMRLERAVVPGPHRHIDGVEMVEIVSGLSGGEVLAAHARAEGAAQ